VVLMKKFLVLLFIPLLVAGVFAASSSTASPLNLQGLLSGANAFIQGSQGMQLEVQVKMLEVFNAMKLTSTQASLIANYMKDFQSNVNALQDQRISELKSLRDALVTNDATGIAQANRKLAELDNRYAKLTTNFVTEIKSTITLEQVTLLQNYFKRSMMMNQQKLLEGPSSWNQHRMQGSNVQNEISNALPGKTTFTFTVDPQQMYNMMLLFGKISKNVKAEMLRSPDLIYTFVNFPLYNLAISTLELKAQ
jgi:hypothetical protein